MKKPKPATYVAYDYDECEKYLSKKCGRDFRNYAGKTYKQGDDSPYQDFWHFIVDTLEPVRGGFFYMYPDELLEEKDYLNLQGWQIEIINMFKEEFGDEIKFFTDW